MPTWVLEIPIDVIKTKTLICDMTSDSLFRLAIVIVMSRLLSWLENLLQVDSSQVDLCSKFGQKFKLTRLGKV